MRSKMVRRSIVAAAGFLLISALGASWARADTIANSVADFSGIQGQGGWYYGYETTLGGALDTSPADIIYSGSGQTGTWDRSPSYKPPWTTIGQVLMHPNGTNSYPYEVEYAVRRFDYTGVGAVDVQITGHFSKLDDSLATVGDGVDGYILLNGTTIASFHSNDINNQFTAPVTIPVLKNGDILDFAVGPGPNNEDSADHTDYEVNIASPSAAPLPSSALGGLALFGGLGLVTIKRRRARCN